MHLSVLVWSNEKVLSWMLLNFDLQLGMITILERRNSARAIPEYAVRLIEEPYEDFQLTYILTQYLCMVAALLDDQCHR